MKVYYINLNRSTERRAWMESQLSKLVVPFERISAVDGHRMSAEAFGAAVEWSELRTKGLSYSEIGCFLSHRMAWQRISEHSENFGAVIEDDVLLSNHIDKFLIDDTWIPDCAALVRIETTNFRVQLTNCHGSGKLAGITYSVSEFKNIFGAGAYILHRDMATWLVDRFVRIGDEVDKELMGQELFRNGRPKFAQLRGLQVQLVPALAVQQFFCKERFLPENAEISTMHCDALIQKSTVSSRDKIVREVCRIFDPTQYKRRLLLKRIPLLM